MMGTTGCTEGCAPQPYQKSPPAVKMDAGIAPVAKAMNVSAIEEICIKAKRQLTIQP